MSIFKCFEKTNASTEYKKLLHEINPLVSHLQSKHDVNQCGLWLAKLDEATKSEFSIRNKLLLDLKNCLTNRKLKYPFTEPPSNIPLKDIQQLTEGSATARNEADDVEMSHDKIIHKYQQRSAKYKTAIEKYQAQLKDLVDMSIEETDRPGQEHSNPNQEFCICDDSPPQNSLQVSSAELLYRIDSLELQVNELKDAFAKNNSRADIQKGKKKRRQSGSQHKSVMDRTDMLVRELESKIRETTLQSVHKENSLLEKTLVDKCNELERKYQKILEKRSEEHEKERKADAKVIEKLQAKLVLGSGDVTKAASHRA